MKNKLTLQKNERLKSRGQIEHLFNKGKSFSVFPYRVVYLFGLETQKRPVEILKAGFTVSSKFFKKSADRNRIKRLTREAYRLQKKKLAEKLFLNKKSLDLFLLFTGKEVPGFALVDEKVGLILKRLMQQADEKNIADT